MICHECALDRHRLCSGLDVADEQPSDYDDDEDGEYVETTYFCCCGQEWTSIRETVSSEYRRMNEQLKPLQWPEAPRATEQASWPDQAGR